MLPNLTKLNLAQIKQALINGGYSGEDITHASFANVVDGGKPVFRYIIIWPSDTESGSDQGNIYVFVGTDGLIKAEF